MGEQPDECHIPAHIDHASPVIFCWDNNDLTEETLSGRGTTDCTSGIVIERATDAGHKATTQPPRELQKKQSKRRSVKAMPAPLVEHNAGTHCGPQPATIPEDADNNPSLNEPQSQGLNSKEFEAAIDFDLVWLLLQICTKHSKLFGRPEADKQLVPAWSGFNSQLARVDCPPRSTVGYLPIIPVSPTELATVNELLR